MKNAFRKLPWTAGPPTGLSTHVKGSVLDLIWRGVPIQELSHPKPAAVIPPDEAQAVVDQQWAQSVQLLAPATLPHLTDATDEDLAAQASTSAWVPPAQQECLLPNAFALTRAGAVSLFDL